MGIIPARAGFTVFGPEVMSTEKDHPRSRGVYLCFLLEVIECLGSSPLARGLHFSSAQAKINERIIPARAGFTP